jgi:putative membrane protein
MIKRYSDHAANERTFLAWVRTAIAVMAFGFLIERFDLFLRYIAPQAAQPQLSGLLRTSHMQHLGGQAA